MRGVDSRGGAALGIDDKTATRRPSGARQGGWPRHGPGYGTRPAQGLRRDGDPPRPRSRHRGRRVRRPRRTVGLRQVDAASHDRRARERHRRRDQDRRARRQQPRPRRARHRHGLPELRALPAQDRAPEHGLRPQAPPHRQGRGRRPRRPGGGDPRPDAAARALPAPALRRPAPAGGDGPGDRPRPAGLPLRRAALQPRRQAPRADARRDQGAPPAAAHHHRLRHPRPDRGDDHGRQDRGDERRPHRAGRRPARRSTTGRRTSSSPRSSARRR